MPTSKEHKILDKAVFEQLFKTHFVHLCNFAYQFVKDTDSAKDITQKIFINLWENRENIDTQKSIQSYLFTSVRNRCMNYIRDQKKYRSFNVSLVNNLSMSSWLSPFPDSELSYDLPCIIAKMPRAILFCRQFSLQP